MIEETPAIQEKSDEQFYIRGENEEIAKAEYNPDFAYLDFIAQVNETHSKYVFQLDPSLKQERDIGEYMFGVALTYLDEQVHTCEVSLEMVEEAKNYTVGYDGPVVYLDDYKSDHVIVCGSEQPKWIFDIPMVIETEYYDPSDVSYKFGVNEERLKDVVQVKEQSTKLEIDPRLLTHEQ